MKSCCDQEQEVRPWWEKKGNWFTLGVIVALLLALLLQQRGLL